MSERSIRSKKLPKIIFLGTFYIGFLFWKKNERFAHSLFFNERCDRIAQVAHQNEQYEQIPQVAHQKWATVSESLRSLTKNERMSESLVFFEQIAYALIFSQKLSDSLRKPMSEFPALAVHFCIKNSRAHGHWRNCLLIPGPRSPVRRRCTRTSMN